MDTEKSIGPYQFWDINIDFKADRGGDASGTQKIRLRWDKVSEEGEESQLLLRLWKLWYDQETLQMQSEGVKDLFFAENKPDSSSGIG